MPKFNYVGRERSGRRTKGKIKAVTKRDAISNLREKGIRVIELKEIPETILSKEIYIGNPVKLQDFTIFLRQFATLLRSGVSVVKSIGVLEEQTGSKALKKALATVEEDLRSGNSLSNSCAKMPKIFPSIYVNMVHAGEIGGNLDDTLDRLADFFEKQNNTKKKIQSAMAYPLILSVVAVGVVIFLLSFVVPTFADMFADFGGELPWITQFVLKASGNVQKYWWLILLIIIAIPISFKLLKQKPSSRYYLDYAILKLPIFGKMLQKAVLARMSRTLSSLFSSSVPVLQALSIVERVVENEVIAKVIREAKHSLEQGESLVGPFKRHWAFPALVTQMIAIGEETGALDAMLAKVADFYEMEVDNATDTLKALIEPLMIVVLSVVVGVIVLSIMVPMFEIFNQVENM